MLNKSKLNPMLCLKKSKLDAMELERELERELEWN